MEKSVSNEIERNILRNLLEKVCALPVVDSTIKDSKLIRQTQSKLKTALRGSTDRCYCLKRTWGGPCESCQADNSELTTLREFYRIVRFPERHSRSDVEFVDRIEQYRKHLSY